MKDQDLNSVFLFKLETAAKQFRKYKNRIFKEKNIDITSDQWILLKNISEDEGISQIALAKRSKKEAAAVTRTLDLLEKKCWIERRDDPDNRRVYKLFTTQSGKKLIADILPIALKVRSQARKEISEDELTIFNKVIDKIFDNLN